MTLDERYGRTRRSVRHRRGIFIGVAAAFVVVLGGWLLWAGLFAPSSAINVEDTGHVIVGDSLVQVKYQLTVDPGTPAQCAVQALNKSFGVVGWKVVDVPPSTQRVRALQDEVRTSEQAVSGLIYRCWPA